MKRKVAHDPRMSKTIATINPRASSELRNENEIVTQKVMTQSVCRHALCKENRPDSFRSRAKVVATKTPKVAA